MMAARVTPIEATLSSSDAPHVPVLLTEVLEALAPRAGMTIVDATLGPGGHAEALLRAVGPSGRVIGIDRDREALTYAAGRLAGFGARFLGLQGDHREIEAILRGAGIAAVDGILADLGVSSLQLDDPRRGFSFVQDGPLDMRMDATAGRTAADLVATLDEGELAGILTAWGEERAARRIARAIVRERERRPLETTGALAALVARVLGPAAHRFRIHPATRTFQALRIAVNREIEGLAEFVHSATSLLAPSGRLAVISFHSLEDRAVKTAMRDLAQRCTCPPDLPVCACGNTPVVRVLTSRPIVPSDEEVRRNTRARSAKLRAVEKI